jgi:hypothetical protein
MGYYAMNRAPVLKVEYNVQLRISDGETIGAIFQCFDDSLVQPPDKSCRLILRYGDNKSKEAAAGDFFAALDLIRYQLDEEMIVPLVNGVSRNCYPSGMARDMGSGLSVYRLTMGKQAAREDLVKTFEVSGEIEPVGILAQKEYYQDWLGSLGR